jgi:hypothetical protein
MLKKICLFCSDKVTDDENAELFFVIFKFSIITTKWRRNTFVAELLFKLWCHNIIDKWKLEDGLLVMYSPYFRIS